MELHLDLEIKNQKFLDKLQEEKIKDYIMYVLGKEYEIGEKDPFVSIILSDNDFIKNINAEYRGKDRTTDVISFAYHDSGESFEVFDILGDIIISLDRVEEQSIEYGHNFEREFYYVLTHGILHLLGYDHLEEDEKVLMRKKEEELLEAYGYRR